MLAQNRDGKNGGQRPGTTVSIIDKQTNLISAPLMP